MNTVEYQKFLSILKEEMVPAMGCTEPIAIAYAASKAKDILQEEVVRLEAFCSGNIIKNTKCVIVPNTGNLIGIEASAIIGILAGNTARELEVIAEVSDEAIAKTKELVKQDFCQVNLLDTNRVLHIVIKAYGENHSCSVEIQDAHTHITKIQYDDQTIFEEEGNEKYLGSFTDRSCLSLEKIYHFANTCELEDIKFLVQRQIQYNMAIANEGLTGNYGIGLGKVLLETGENSVFTQMKAYTAAASEARMCGCSLPVVTNSGSGNQGITCSVPVIVYAKEKNKTKEQLWRTLVFSNLMTIHQKTRIGRLSAFCGAVSAACAAGCAISYIENASIQQLRNTITNTLADIPGIVCDGAKATCAAKIATSVDAAMMAHQLAMRNRVYDSTLGILKEDIESTISAVGYLGKYGMKETDEEILNIMLDTWEK
ncbi:MAG: serine dehydratase subunit alpha family protein [Erysipelotrichaceae bacterium]|nr:serine dehydratase subunit alpha family protein [Erysipelotrichaceae bacterium]